MAEFTRQPQSSRQPHITHCHTPTSWSSNVTYHDAQQVLQKLIVKQSQSQGFDSATSSALHELTHITERFITALFSSASHCAELCNRTIPSSRDLLYALETHGIPPSDLHNLSKGKARSTFTAPQAIKQERTDTASGFLASDSEQEEDDPAWQRVASQIVPDHLPGRPPKHCWVKTAAYPPNAYSGASSQPLKLVDSKLANARLVESSLRRLIRDTDSVAAASRTQEILPPMPMDNAPRTLEGTTLSRLPPTVNYKNIWSGKRKRKWKI